jgi:outer membrane protein insertion porin family
MNLNFPLKQTFFFAFVISLFIPFSGKAQVAASNIKKYKIAQIDVKGNNRDAAMIILRSGLASGDYIKVPGDAISNAIKKLWDASLFSDIQIYIEKTEGENIALAIQVVEKAQINEFVLEGIKKSEREDLEESLKAILFKSHSVNSEMLVRKLIIDYYADKGRFKPIINIEAVADTSNSLYTSLKVTIDRGNKVKVGEINFNGNHALPNKKLRKSMGEVKVYQWFNPFRTSDYNVLDYEEGKDLLINKYKNYGFRDVVITNDTVSWIDEKKLKIDITVDEGKRYYYRNVKFEGNTKFTNKELTKYLGIKKGDVYSTDELNKMLTMDPQGQDVSSLYLDDGYLFFNVQPIETSVIEDSVDILIKIYEGGQAVIGKISIVGNNKTSDHVILREIYTKPGELFKRSDIIRSQRELANLKYFNPEKLQVNPTPNPATGTVDIEYVVEEQPSDQFELQGGFGAGTIVGTLGVSFTNFSTKNFFNKKSWQPIPAGDGQSLSLRAQSSGRFYSSFNFSFVEPWLGGKKPTALSVSLYNTRLNATSTDGHQYIYGASVGLGTRLRKPDNFFRLQGSLGYQYYDVDNYPGLSLAKGFYNNANIKITLSRSSVDQPIYPRSGSEIQLSSQSSFPGSLFNPGTDYTVLPDNEKFKWIEYHKHKAQAAWYTTLVEKLVMYNKVNFGVMFAWNKDIGISPFERYYMGGSGLSGFNIDGREIIPLRGYTDASSTNVVYKGDALNGGVAAVKYTMELRYPISLQPQATVYALGFLEAGNTYSKLSEFDVFDVKRTAGAGIRLFLPMIGMLGFDYGFPFNPANNVVNEALFKSTPGQFTFTFGGNLSGW